MDRWEICYVDFIRHTLIEMTPDGLRETKIKRNKSLDDDSKAHATARIVTQLGLDGWELTNGSWNIGPILYFKRRIGDWNQEGGPP